VKNERITQILLILIILILLLFPPRQTIVGSPAQVTVNPGVSVVPLGENRVLITETNPNSGLRGQAIILEYDEKEKKLKLVGEDNWKSFLYK